MINDAVLRNKFYSWITKYVLEGAVVIWENQAEIRPKPPYVSLHMLSGPLKRGDDDFSLSNTGDTTLSGPRQITFSINFFGKNAIGAMSRIQSSFELPSCSTHFNAEKMAFISDSGIRDLSSQVQENRFETRAQMDVRFTATGSMTETGTGYIEQVEVTNDIDNSINIINEIP